MIDTGDLLDWVASVGWQTPHSTVTKNQTMSEFILVSYFYANFCIKNEDQFPLSSYVILYTHTQMSMHVSTKYWKKKNALWRSDNQPCETWDNK